MVKFIDIDPDEIPNLRATHRGRVSYPILKAFLESGKVLAQLDRTGIQQSLQTLNSALGAYIRNHDMPIRLFQRRGQLFLVRTDTDEKGNLVENMDAKAAPPIEDELDARFEEEKNQTTK